MGPYQGRVEGKENLPRPAGHTPLDAPQDPISFLGSQVTLLARGQPVLTSVFNYCLVRKLDTSTFLHL